MSALTMRGIRLGLAALIAGSGLVASVEAVAQIENLPPNAVVQALPDQDKGAELRRHLTTIADNPHSLSALTGAGRAALDMGDAEAAVGFFARAGEIAPTDARVKAGMASALLRMEQAQAALSLFAEAVALGAPEIEIAADRGLAYDLTGDPGRAQQDYILALRSRDDPEVRRRLALSLGISGERDAAMAAIDAQLRAQDLSAWRTRALVLALTGDATGADEAARATLPAHSAQVMAPFLARLAQLDPAQKAAAVHFGHFPADGQPARVVFTEAERDREPPPRPSSPTVAAAALASSQPGEAGSRPSAEQAESPRQASRPPKSGPARPAHPSRHWVQIAGGADKAALPREFARLKAMASDLLGRREAYTTTLRLTNRLLVGPFASEREAQDFVNRLARHDVAAFAWTSPAGQEIEKLPTRR